MTSVRSLAPLGRLPLLTLIVMVGPQAPCWAHPLAFTDTTIVLLPDGSFQTDLICDLDALALGRAAECRRSVTRGGAPGAPSG